MKKVWIIPIEPLETRYTGEWMETFPKQLRRFAFEQDKEIIASNIEGRGHTGEVTPGAFLNFADTNIYKSDQMKCLAVNFQAGDVRDGDYIIFMDAWNPTIIQARYMIDLLGLDVKIGALWHAGAYDPADFLGRAAGGKSWSGYTELAIYNSVDDNFFATDFHFDMFRRYMVNNFRAGLKDPVIAGWPMEYMKDKINDNFNPGTKKKDMILFPHRMSEEKRPDIFRKLADMLPQYEFVFAQEQKRTKKEYHELLWQSKIVFSANEQETLGISTCIEGPIAGCIPMAPDRLSYIEIFEGYESFLYGSKLLKDPNLPVLADHIEKVMKNYEKHLPSVVNYTVRKMPKYSYGTEIYRTIMS